MKILFLGFCVLMTSCHTINSEFGLKDENIIQETAQAAIEYETGVRVDFTPNH